MIQASSLIETRTGLAVSTQLRSDLENIIYDQSQGDLERFVRELSSSSEIDPIWQRLLNALAIGETYFFRDLAHFKLLKSQILPSLVLQRRQQQQLSLNLWSLGCATGEEPYSVAMTLHEFLPDLPQWTVRLIGTDINSYALQTARQGIYRNWAFRQSTEGSFRQRYFDPVDGGVQIKPHIRDMVIFRQAKLLDDPPLPQLDVIFCRNVLIYFQSDHVQAAEDRLYEALAPGGWLILGQSEAIRFHRERWITHLFPGTTIYQKPLKPAPLPPGEFEYRQYSQPAIEVTETKEIAAVVAPSYKDALEALQNEDPDEAQRYLANVLLYQPDHAPAHLLLASVFANRRALLEAYSHIDTALRIDPLLADAHYLRAMLRLEAGSIADAKKSLSAALYCQRNHSLASFMLGNLHAQDGDISRATRAWENARRAIAHFTSDSPLSDISDMTVGNLRALLDSQLEGWS
jgi:chemotaxis protein methyltransferase CheR